MACGKSTVYTVFFLTCLVFSFLSWGLYQHVSQIEPHCDIDSKAYLEHGTLFAQTGHLAAESSSQPYYALGYSLVIGLLYKLCGTSPATIIVFQVLLALFSCWLMMSTVRRVFGCEAACFCSAIFLLSVGYLVFTQFILTELTLSFLLLIFFERLTAFLYQQSSVTPLILAGLSLGSSVVIKPAAIYFVFIVCFLLLWFITGRWWRRCAKALLFAAFFYIPVVGYMAYNYAAFGNFSNSTLDRVNLYFWFFPNVLAQENNTTSDIERDRLLVMTHGTHNFAIVETIFIEKLRQKPFLFIVVWLKNVFKTYAGLYTTNLKVLIEPRSSQWGIVSYFKMPGNLLTRMKLYFTAGTTKRWVVAVGIFEAIWSLIRYVLCALGLLFLFQRRDYGLLMLSLCFLAYFSLITGHDGCARFRMMFEFLLIILAAGGLSGCAKKN